MKHLLQMTRFFFKTKRISKASLVVSISDLSWRKWQIWRLHVEIPALKIFPPFLVFLANIWRRKTFENQMLFHPIRRLCPEKRYHFSVMLFAAENLNFCGFFYKEKIQLREVFGAELRSQWQIALNISKNKILASQHVILSENNSLETSL